MRRAEATYGANRNILELGTGNGGQSDEGCYGKGLHFGLWLGDECGVNSWLNESMLMMMIFKKPRTPSMHHFILQ